MSHKIPTKKVIILISIIPLILFIIGSLTISSGMYYSLIQHTAAACWWTHPNLYVIFCTISHSIWYIFTFIPSYYFYVTCVEMSHLFLSWSESIQKSQYMERSELLSQSKSFIRMLNHYKKIISSFIFWGTLSFFILALSKGYLTLRSITNGLDPVVNIAIIITFI